jgi:hypothetical protein
MDDSRIALSIVIVTAFSMAMAAELVGGRIQGSQLSF